MKFQACKKKVFNRGVPSDSFLSEMVEWAKGAPDAVFMPNSNADIFSKTIDELGPWEGPRHRLATMLEVMRVLAGFESSWKWTKGVDVSRSGGDNNENSEAGAWQVSYDSRHLADELRTLLVSRNITNGAEFQRRNKSDHPFAMLYVSTLLRHNTKHNGPLYKGDERSAIRSSLRGAEQSIYPWLSRDAVREFEGYLQT